MANRKISDLTALTAPVTGDLLPIVDISEAAAADKNKKITYGTFLSSVPLGTAAAPSIAFTGDINTGIYSPGADQVAISTNGTEKLIVKSDGKVGIGTGTPVDKLTVAGATVSAAIFNTTIGTTASPSFCKLNFYGYLQNSTWNVASISAGNSANNTYAGILQFATNTEGGTHTTAVTIDNQQRVGIGTASLNALLELSLNNTTAPASGTLPSGIGVSFSANDGANAGLWFSADFGGSSQGYCGMAGARDSGYDTSLRFYTNNASSSVPYTERLRLDPSGRVLVGGSSDSGGALLQVFGDRIRIGTAKTPASASATGTTGEIAWDANYIYVCTATNTWKRTAIATW